MAINFGDILGGLGAAYGGRAQEYAEGIRQREQGLTEQKRAELEARQRAMYEDADTALRFLTENPEDPRLTRQMRANSVIQLAEDRLDALSSYPDADPSDTLQILRDAQAMRDQDDPMAINRLMTTLFPAASIYRQRFAPQQEQAEYTLSPGERRMRGSEVIAEVPEAPSQQTPFTEVGKLRADLMSGRITPQEYQTAIEAMRQTAIAQPRAATTNLGKLNQDLQAGNITPEQYQQEINAAIQEREMRLSTEEAKVTERESRDQMVSAEIARAYDLAAKLLANESGLAGATGPISSWVPSFRESTVDFESDLQELQSLLTMANLGRMTGVLSESDIKLIGQAASGLNSRASEQRMREKLAEIKARLEGRLGIQQQATQAPEMATEEPMVINGYTIKQVN